MIQVLLHHEVADYQSWCAAFDSAFDFRKQGGERACRVFRQAGNPNDLTLLFDWEDLRKAQRYMNWEELRNKMKQAGVWAPPRSTTLRKCIRFTAARRIDRLLA